MTTFHIPPKLGSRLREKGRSNSLSDSLPTFNGLHEKHTLRKYRTWTSTFYIPLPWPLSRCTRVRHFKIILPIPAKASKYMSNLARSRSRRFNQLMALISIILLFWNLRNFFKSSLHFNPKPTTLVFSQEDLKRIWEWEVASGHYQSHRPFPNGSSLDLPLLNPGIPPQDPPITTPHASRKQVRSTVGSGLRRTYVDMQSLPHNVGYPPRPVPGSVADLDIVMEECDFGNNKYVRDCLEVLRVGAGLDRGRRLRRGNLDAWKYIYVEEGQRLTLPTPPRTPPKTTTSGITSGRGTSLDESLEPPLHLPPPRSYWTSSELATACDPDHPRIFHIFWGGLFTSHPYATILSFLFTQNLGLHLSPNETTSICRPQFWVWIQTGPAREANPKPSALKEMYDSLSNTPWSAPFLHPRFKDIIKFKLWNTTEQLDNIRELKDEWRSTNLFNSGGHVYEIPPDIDDKKSQFMNILKSRRDEDDLMNRMGSTSSASYDRMRTILSDLARFVLCHRYGGIYLDTDTIFLRDWEELWGWKGAFAYRWSRLPQYNTAVLKLNKGSALGTFLTRTALRHGLDFHPMTAITAYAEDAGLDNLLLRLPDALFDSPWLNTEGFQKDRPPSPPLTEFPHFFETPSAASSDAQSAGFEGFFRGAYSYHWHNSWWKPWDPARNWPDLGPRFAEAERLSRLQAVEAARVSQQAESFSFITKAKAKARRALSIEEEEENVEDDKRDLDWSTILKRTFESYIRGDSPNMYGEWIHW